MVDYCTALLSTFAADLGLSLNLTVSWMPKRYGCSMDELWVGQASSRYRAAAADCRSMKLPRNDRS
jgi:hypothetical protein